MGVLQALQTVKTIQVEIIKGLISYIILVPSTEEAFTTFPMLLGPRQADLDRKKHHIVISAH